ncbi:thiosulfate/3-mercaptopyruvate sulfurtransferase [Marininema mesophilum]|uniref:Thiosulfate/3-mercaptopyruvate sulfurtransferase n=1 Tax=Marininema mesophilum TaxID=1048340 RepID=A0A1H2YGI1_9BACL|nr:sulfurtransferase [Marininema mesophilum]SDX04276.1 thiosulfate/3-mercaptopyruvate sulfurtransferase [Marininema mesophilum]
MQDVLVKAMWLNEHLNDPSLVIADCRFDLTNPSAGKNAYEESHIPGAVYFHLDEELSGPVEKHGGRHPLPDLTTFAALLGDKGIDHEKTVIVYDDQGGAMAARLWWMLQYLGHERVAVLDGGFTGWREAGYSVTSEKTTILPTQFDIHIRKPKQLVQMEEIQKGENPLIDSREPDRYHGKVEPIDKKAGHIPGALNRFWKENLTEGQHWKSSQTLKREWSFISSQDAPIVYCGSGVTACANMLALQRAGIHHARLYLGSWSDWISYEENPVHTSLDSGV